MDKATLDTIVSGSHSGSRKVMSHAPRHDAISVALDAGVDFVHHIPRILPSRPLKSHNSSNKRQSPFRRSFRCSQSQAQVSETTRTLSPNLSVAGLLKAGVPILAGSDATGLQIPPNQLVPMGISLHQELELLVAAGLSSANALRAATSLPAKYFNLHGRGIIAPGFRADLVLVRGDLSPTFQSHRRLNESGSEGLSSTHGTKQLALVKK